MSFQNNIFLGNLIRLNFKLNHVFIKPFFISLPPRFSWFKHVNRTSGPIHPFSLLLLLRDRASRSINRLCHEISLRHVKSVMSNLQWWIIWLWKTIRGLDVMGRKPEILVKLDILSEAIVNLQVLLVWFCRFVVLFFVFLKLELLTKD